MGRRSVDFATLDPDTTVTSPSQLVGTWGTSTPCTATPRPASSAPDGTPLHDDEVCVPGGAFVFGARGGALGQALTDDLPEQVALVSSFLMDRYEVTVAGFRKGIADGFTGGLPIANDGPLGTTGPSLCTWSDAPLGREEYPLTCIDRDVARAFCRFAGGDLPEEVQWEYAAASAGRAARSYYPWGDGNGERPSCGQAVYGRMAGGECVDAGIGPAPVAALPGDVTPLGIMGLAGNAMEWTADTFTSRSAGCWMSAGLLDPECAPLGIGLTVRGGTWDQGSPQLLSTFRVLSGGPGGTVDVGLRCVRKGASP